jgi:hypothetical protein
MVGGALQPEVMAHTQTQRPVHLLPHERPCPRRVDVGFRVRRSATPLGLHSVPSRPGPERMHHARSMLGPWDLPRREHSFSTRRCPPCPATVSLAQSHNVGDRPALPGRLGGPCHPSIAALSGRLHSQGSRSLSMCGSGRTRTCEARRCLVYSQVQLPLCDAPMIDADRGRLCVAWVEGLEPPTFGFGDRRSAAELHPSGPFPGPTGCPGQEAESGLSSGRILCICRYGEQRFVGVTTEPAWARQAGVPAKPVSPAWALSVCFNIITSECKRSCRRCCGQFRSDCFIPL